MKDALDEVRRDYRGREPRRSPSPAITARPEPCSDRSSRERRWTSTFPPRPSRWMRSRRKGLVLSKARAGILLRNEVVLIVPKDSASHISSFQDLARPDVKPIALGRARHRASRGSTRRNCSLILGFTARCRPKAVLGQGRATSVLTYVETGEVDAGIVYSTDAASSSKGERWSPRLPHHRTHRRSIPWP